jgi:hypothetical protein
MYREGWMFIVDCIDERQDMISAPEWLRGINIESIVIERFNSLNVFRRIHEKFCHVIIALK